MTRFRRKVVAYVSTNTAQANSAAETLSGRRSQLAQAARSCGLSVRRWFADDLAILNGDPIESSLGLTDACHEALSKKQILVVNCDAASPGLRKAQVRLMEEGVEFYDLEMLRDSRDGLRAQSDGAKNRSEKRESHAVLGRAQARAKGTAFGSRNLPKAREVAAKSSANAAAIRRREYVRWFAEAEAEGVTTPKQIALWLNSRGLQTPRGFIWSEVNVRRIEKDLGRFAQLGGVEADRPAQERVTNDDVEAAKAAALADLKLKKAEDDRITADLLSGLDELIEDDTFRVEMSIEEREALERNLADFPDS